MKSLLYLMSISVLLSVTGCVIVPGHREREREHGEHWERQADHGGWHGQDHEYHHSDHD